MGQIIDQQIPVPIEGYDDSSPEWLLPDTRTPDMENCKIEDGILKDRDGYTEVAASFSAASNNPVMECFEWGDSSGTLKPVFITSEGLVEFTSPSTWTARFGASALTGDATNPVLATPLESTSTENFYVTNGTDPIKVWTGTGNWANLTTTGKTNLRAGCLLGWNGHLIAGDITENAVDYPFQIMWSKINDATVWNTTSSGFANLTRDRLNGRVQCMVPLGDVVMVYKNNSIYQISYQGDPNYFVGRLRVDNVGAISRKAVAQFDDGLHFVVSENDFHVFDGRSFIKPSIGTRIKKKFFNDLNWDARGTIFTMVDEDLFEVWTFYPSGAATSPDAGICWNWRDNTMTPHTFGDTIYSGAIFKETFSGGRENLIGLNANVMKFQNGTTDDGTAITAYWRTPLRNYSNLGQGLATSIKTVRRVEWDIKDTSPLPQVQVGTTNNLTDTISYTTAEVVRDGTTGVKMTTHNHSSGRFLTYKMTNNSGAASFNTTLYYPYIEYRTGVKR